MGNDAGVITWARQEATQFLLPKKTANFNQTIIMTSLNTSPFFVPGDHQIKKPSRLHVCEFCWKKVEIPPTIRALKITSKNLTLQHFKRSDEGRRPTERSVFNLFFFWLTIKDWNLQVRFWREKWNEIIQVIFKHCTVKYYNWNWSNNVINWICQLIWKGVTLWHCLRLDFLLRKLILTRCEVLWCSAEIQFSKSDITENNTIINIAMPTL